MNDPLTPAMSLSLIDTIEEHANLPEKTISDIRQLAENNPENFTALLVQKKLLPEKALLSVLGKLYRLPVQIDLPMENFRADFTDTVPIQFLKKHVIFPLDSQEDDMMTGTAETRIAVNDPSDLAPVDDLVRMLNIMNYRVVLSSRESILSAINICYDLKSGTAEELVETMEEDETAIYSEIEETADLLDDTSSAPVIKLVNYIISQAIKANASDIHIEPYRNSFKVRRRVDGILYDMLTPPKWIQSPLVARIKVMAKMKIDEKRLPQDSRINVRIGNQEVDIRVSTLPTVFGERVVMRLLNKSASLMSLGELGLSQDRLTEFNRLIQSANGIFLVTGPTGSGKTTTLYAVLSKLNQPDINIITIEDPVEYQINGINQIQVNPKIDLTFSSGLRSIVRQDPDVILVGEIRDRETADIAIQSALTGHLVFSTLHTNDAASTITRLVDIGAEPFLLSSSLIGVAAQRLVRVLCRHCKTPFDPDNAELAGLGIERKSLNGEKFYHANGCAKCFQTGYSGRIAIFEIMPMDRHLKNLILKTYDSSRIKQEAVRRGMVTLREDAVLKVINGITTIEEVLRVTHTDQAMDI